MLTESTVDNKHSIILVEDDIDVSNILAGHFNLAKFKVYKTASAIECLAKLKELNNRVDIILINGTIAADRGPMLIVNIRKLNLDVKIFALAENENSKTRVLDYGADEFAVKPISPTTVVEKISMLLMKKPVESQIK
ncbi:Response regulator SaeR [Candidatus Nitrosocosmicus oleophilus]|uniref:Response regulator SaeR n=1 Tax=Candidatus Nitrosocosmicus oleophilus TaxID=1353260 RepID=A0A654LSM3_9ARCH|nr:response regulator [Candidatus Nitrosocosmicus oleophilus]ALI34215.1 Response regulator SaeR [Candidatus Nitrosocosmicus oleophilus]